MSGDSLRDRMDNGRFRRMGKKVPGHGFKGAVCGPCRLQGEMLGRFSLTSGNRKAENESYK